MKICVQFAHKKQLDKVHLRAIKSANYAEQKIWSTYKSFHARLGAMKTLLSEFLPVDAHLPLKAFCFIACFILIFAAFAPAQTSPEYGSMTACNAMTIGTPTTLGAAGGGALNGFVPFTSSSVWNTNIYNAPVDPTSNTLAAVWAAAGGYTLHPEFGSTVARGGIPYYVVDSTQTPIVAINVIDDVAQSDVVIAPYPDSDVLPIENAPTDCSDQQRSCLGARPRRLLAL